MAGRKQTARRTGTAGASKSGGRRSTGGSGTGGKVGGKSTATASKSAKRRSSGAAGGEFTFRYTTIFQMGGRGDQCPRLY